MGTASWRNAADIWRERIAAQSESGSSIRAWCRDGGYSEHSFYSWRAKLGLRPHEATARLGRQALAAPVDSIPFAEVMIATASQPMCLKLAGGRELVLPGSMPIEQVAKLLRLVEGQP